VLESLRKDSLRIFEECLKAADPEGAVHSFVHISENYLFVEPDIKIDLNNFDRVFVVGAGKASAPMARALESILGGKITRGLITVKHGHGLDLKRIRVTEAGHPIPDSSGLKATSEMINLLSSVGANDLVFSCISGGGSALLPSPADGVTLEDKQIVTSLLIESGADIHEINTVRKHLSASKGGRLMRHAYPALVISLILSDVVGDDPSLVASGPFAPDSATFQDAFDVIQKYKLEASAPTNVTNYLRRGISGDAPETPKPFDRIFSRAKNVIVGSNLLSLEAGKKLARSLGYNSMILSSVIEGDTTQAALFHAAISRELANSNNPLGLPACVLSGGETTVKVEGNGFGGRNQHFVLSLLEKIKQVPGCVVLSAGSDGTDGPTDAAGAIADTDSFNRAAYIGLAPDFYLANFNSYNFFEQLHDLIFTGPTLTNVMDIRLVMVGN
jgi:glycerate 2-kinase